MQRWHTAVCGCALIGIWTLGTAGAQEKKDEPKVEKAKAAAWGEIEIKGAYPEGAPTPGLFGELHENLADAVARLDKAAADDKLTGLVLKINSPSIGWAKLHELRQAILRVRAKGKKVHAWLETGDGKEYLVATACDDISMPESGALLLLGLRAEVSFYKNMFDKLDVKPEMLRVGEFKSAAEPYNRTEMSPEFRLEMEAILDDYFKQIIALVAEQRKLAPEMVQEAIDAAPLTAGRAKELGLIDRLAYEDQLKSTLPSPEGTEAKVVAKYGKKKIDTDFSGFNGMIKMMNLMMGVEEPKRKTTTPKIAVIYASGAIMTGASTSDLLGESTLGSDTLIKAIRQARDDDKVKAIVLRVDSPGGSALASDLIWRELEIVKKPFIASMGDVAASGGYYISMGADKIFAEPGTLTGSIGVVGGKIALQGLYEKVGINTTVLSRGKNSGVMSSTSGFTDSEREAMQKLLNDVYDQFTKKAAAGRGMEHAKLEALARGRVYTGTMAKQIGLVDELGTLDEAIAFAKQAAGLGADEKVERLELPRPVSPFESLFGPLDLEARVQRAQAETLGNLLDLAPGLRQEVSNLTTFQRLAREPRLVIQPFQLQIK